MPFVAKSRSSGKRLDLTQIDEPQRLDRRDVMCQLCGGDMVLKCGQIIRPHFAHLARTCSSDYRFHPESLDHLIAKQVVVSLLRRSYADFLPDILLEYAIEDRKRVADVMCIWSTGWWQAHEVQLASITQGELEERTNDYAEQGIDVRWWLGKRADTPRNREWCNRKCGEVGLVSFYEEDDVGESLPARAGWVRIKHGD